MHKGVAVHSPDDAARRGEKILAFYCKVCGLYTPGTQDCNSSKLIKMIRFKFCIVHFLGINVNVFIINS